MMERTKKIRTLRIATLAAFVVMGLTTAGAHAAVIVDDFDSPDPGTVYVIDFANPDPTLIKHTAAGIIGGERDVLIDVIGTPGAVSASGEVGGGTLNFTSASPGSSATLQYDGIDAGDSVGPPASLSNADGLGGLDLTQSGDNTGFTLAFLSVDSGAGTELDFEIHALSTGGGTADYSGSVSDSASPFLHFVPFASFALAGGFSFTDVSSLWFVFNPAGVDDVDFEVDFIALQTNEPSTLVLMGFGIVAVGLVMLRRHRRRSVA